MFDKFTDKNGKVYEGEEARKKAAEQLLEYFRPTIPNKPFANLYSKLSIQFTSKQRPPSENFRELLTEAEKELLRRAVPELSGAGLEAVLRRIYNMGDEKIKKLTWRDIFIFCKDYVSANKQKKVNTKPTKASGGKAGDNMQAISETTKRKVEAIRDQVFICYSHKDKQWLDDLQTHLKPYVRNGLTAWSDKQIAPGSKWLPEIETALNSAKVTVLLVTPNFLASDFIHEKELGPLLKKTEKGKVRIIWIPVQACSYKETPLKDYQAATDPDKPLANMRKADRDGTWVRICEEIKKAVSR